MNDFKPCPFCGGDAECSSFLIEGNEAPFQRYAVVCRNCKARVRDSIDRGIAVWNWNRRVSALKETNHD